MQLPLPTRPRRSALYVPGSNPRALARAATLRSDVLILDLEDAVLPEAKNQAREAVHRLVAGGGFARREIVIRMNGLATSWAMDDIQSIARSGAAGILIPKVDDAAMINLVDQRLGEAGAPAGFRIWAMAETPRGVLNLADIASASPRMEVIVMGTADLSRALRLPDSGQRDALVPALAACVLAARAAGIDILDGVYTRLTDAAGLQSECEHGRRLGFDGKTLIHPGQIDIANEVFGVPDAEAMAAAALIAGWQAAAAEGSGVAVVDGRMVEQLHVEVAQRRLALHRAIRALEA